MITVLTVFWTLPTTRRAELMVSRMMMALDGVIVVGRGQEEGALTNATMQFTR
jgi:hypothetical protein